MFEFDGTQSKEYVYLNGQPLAVWHGASPATTATVSYKPATGGNDAEERLNSGNVNKTEATLDMAQEDSVPVLVVTVSL